MKHRTNMESYMAGQKNNLLQSVLNAINEIIFIIDRNGTIIEANIALANCFGVDIEVLSGKNIYELLPDDVAADRRAQAEKVFITKKPLRYEDAHLGHTYDASVYPVENETGDVAMVVVFAHDITELKTREVELRQSQEQLRLLFENSLDGIFLTKPDGTISAANPAAQELLGMTEEEIIAAGREKIIDSMDPNLHAALKERSSKGRVRAELRIKRKDGSVFPAEVSSAIFKDSQGNYNSFVVTRDITERKQREAEIRYQAFHDSLTGLPNIRLLREKANLAISLAARYNRFLGVAFLDLDGMKRINDTLGHEAGDILLKEVSKRFSQIIRQSDAISRFDQEPECVSGEMVARFGGDEFIFLLPQINGPDDMEAFANRVLQGLQKPFFIKGEEVSVTASMGISVYPDNGTDLQTLIKKADSAMYTAKANGRNRFSYFGR